MDITGLSGYKMEHVTNSETGVTTVTIKNSSDVEIGNFVLEAYKLDAFFRSLSELMRQVAAQHLVTQQEWRSDYFKNEARADVEFNVP